MHIWSILISINLIFLWEFVRVADVFKKMWILNIPMASNCTVSPRTDVLNRYFSLL